MISAGFALLQPEAFAAKVDRAAPLNRADSAGEPFSVSLERQSRREELSPPEEAVDAEVAPESAQDLTEAAQTSKSDETAIDAEESDSKAETKLEDSAAADAEPSVPDEQSTRNLAEPTAEATPAVIAQSSPSKEPENVAPQAQSSTNPNATLNQQVGEGESTPPAAPTESAPRTATNQSAGGAVAPTAPNQEATTSTTAAESASAVAQTPAPAPAHDRRTNTTDIRQDAVDPAVAADDGAEPVKTARVNPVDAASPSLDSGAHGGESRPIIDSLGRSATATSQATPTPDAGGENRLFEAQVTRGLEAALRQNGGSVTIRLKPETLGALKIDLQIQHGAIAARLEAATPEARELLHQHMATLRTALEAKGFSVRSIEVQVPSAPSGGETNAEFNRSFSGQSQAHSQDAHAGANGHASGRREDPGGASWNNQHHDPLAEDELIEPGWRSVYVNGSLNAVA